MRALRAPGFSVSQKCAESFPGVSGTVPQDSCSRSGGVGARQWNHLSFWRFSPCFVVFLFANLGKMSTIFMGGGAVYAREMGTICPFGVFFPFL